MIKIRIRNFADGRIDRLDTGNDEGLLVGQFIWAGLGSLGFSRSTRGYLLIWNLGGSYGMNKEITEVGIYEIDVDKRTITGPINEHEANCHVCRERNHTDPLQFSRVIPDEEVS